MKKRRRKFLTRDDVELTLLSLPTLAWYVLLTLLPMVGILLAFKSYRLSPGKGFFYSLFASEWKGWDNFKFLFLRKDTFFIIFKTLAYNLVFIALGAIIPVTLAIMIFNLRSRRAAKAYQTMMFLPYFLSWVVISYFIFAFLGPSSGYLSRMLEGGSFAGFNFYGSKANGFWTVFLVFLYLWKNVGYTMVVYLAAITSEDTTCYEAAIVDGASKFQQAIYITLPSLKPVVIVMVMMSLAKVFNSDFGLFYQATRNAAALYPATQTLDVLVYNMLMQSNDISMAAAASFIQSVAGFVLVMLVNWVLKKIDSDNAFI